jgi:hypothetical protein
MAKLKIELTDEQKRKNQQILARIEAEKAMLWEDTRALQEEYRKSGRRDDSDITRADDLLEY